MKIRRLVLLVTAVAGLVVSACHRAGAQATVGCPSGTYDMLDWMTMDSGLRNSNYLVGTANPLYTDLAGSKFYWTKGAKGYPWDIQLYDGKYIYLWITEYAWVIRTPTRNSPTTRICL